MFVSPDELITFAVAAGATEPAPHIRLGRPGWTEWAEPALKLLANEGHLTAEQKATLIAQCDAACGRAPEGCSIADALHELVQPDTLAGIGALVAFNTGVPAGLWALAQMVGG